MITSTTSHTILRLNNLLLDHRRRRCHRLWEQRNMETWQKYHHERIRGVANSRSSSRSDTQVRRNPTQSRLARLAQSYCDRMDGIEELREDMDARFERIDRRLDESFAA